MGDTYYDPQIVKNTLDEDGITANDSKISDYGSFASRALEKEFIYILGDTIPFPNPPDWFKTFANSLTRAKFWWEENNNKELWKGTMEEIKDFRKRLYEEPAAKTRKV